MRFLEPKIKTGTYEEDGWLAKVEVLEDNCNEEESRYLLKVLGTILNPWICKTPEDGHVFEVFMKKQYRHYGGWTLIFDS